MSDQAYEVGIYVLPTEGNRPPRAALLTEEVVVETEEIIMAMASTTEVTWSRDTGTWEFDDGTPVHPELGEAITDHAKDLGVEW